MHDRGDMHMKKMPASQRHWKGLYNDPHLEVTLVPEISGAHSLNVIFPASAFQNCPLIAQCYSMLVGRVISRQGFKCDI